MIAHSACCRTPDTSASTSITGLSERNIAWPNSATLREIGMTDPAAKPPR
ncbi:hypothetical protein ACQGAO_07710 [Rhodococcus sp. 1.20]